MNSNNDNMSVKYGMLVMKYSLLSGQHKERLWYSDMKFVT